MRNRLASLGALLGLLTTASAWGEERPTEQPNRKEAPQPQRPISPESPRAVPDYDGRGSTYESPGGVLWVPRVVLFPLWVVTEFGVRRPLGWLTVTAERANLQNLLIDWFTWGPDRNAGLVPTALIDFGFRPSVGLYFFWNDAFVKDNDIRMHAATGGIDWLRLTFTDRIHLDPQTWIAVRGEASRRPDWMFHGFGPLTEPEDKTRYSSDMLQGSLSLRKEFWETSVFTAFAGVRRTTFDGDGTGSGPDLDRAAARGEIAIPPGFDSGYTIARHGFLLELDSRNPRPHPGSGVRAVIDVEQAGRLAGDVSRQWIRYGGGLGAFWDFTDQNRVVGLSVSTTLVDPLDDGDVPFTEQARLGGDDPMRGFIQGRLIDRSAISARLDYQWPVWTFIDGSLAAEAGNVFGEHLSGFDPELARLSFTLGVRSSGRRDHPFELMVGMGTAPLSEGAEPDAFRLVLGATNGF